MKKFKSFLTENVKDVVDEKYLIKELTSGKFKNNLKYVYDTAKSVPHEEHPDGLLYRGMSDSFVNVNPITLIHYSTERSSANTSNIYNLLVSKYLTSWKDYPKRNRSFICSTASSRASEYTEDGDPCIIVPADSTPIGICSSYDFWYSFPKLGNLVSIRNMSVFNRAVKDFMTNIGRLYDLTILNVNTKTNEEGNRSERNLSKIVSTLKNITPIQLKEKIEQMHDVNLLPFDHIYKYITNSKYVDQNKNIDLMNVFDDLLNAKDNSFSISDYQNAVKVENVEVWMEGPALIISNIHVFVEICDRYYK